MCLQRREYAPTAQSRNGQLALWRIQKGMTMMENEKGKMVCVCVEHLSEEARREVALAIREARRPLARGAKKKKDSLLHKDRLFVVKELLDLHFKADMPWNAAIKALRRRSAYAPKMKSVSNGSWIVYALRQKKADERAVRGGLPD